MYIEEHIVQVFAFVVDVFLISAFTTCNKIGIFNYRSMHILTRYVVVRVTHGGGALDKIKIPNSSISFYVLRRISHNVSNCIMACACNVASTLLGVIDGVEALRRILSSQLWHKRNTHIKIIQKLTQSV